MRRTWNIILLLLLALCVPVWINPWNLTVFDKVFPYSFTFVFLLSLAPFPFLKIRRDPFYLSIVAVSGCAAIIITGSNLLRSSAGKRTTETARFALDNGITAVISENTGGGATQGYSYTVDLVAGKGMAKKQERILSSYGSPRPTLVKNGGNQTVYIYCSQPNGLYALPVRILNTSLRCDTTYRFSHTDLSRHHAPVRQNGETVQTPPRSPAGHYLVILESARTRSSFDSLPNNETVIRSNDYTGLEPGFYIRVDSYHTVKSDASARCDSLRKNHIDCYVKYAGGKVSRRVQHSKKKVPIEITKEVTARYPGFSVDFGKQLKIGRDSIALYVLSKPVEKKIHTHPVFTWDYQTRVIVLCDGLLNEIDDHDFLKPSWPEDTIWENLSTSGINGTFLKQGAATPFVLYQIHRSEGRIICRFLILDGLQLQNHVKGKTRYSLSPSPSVNHEVFIPLSDTSVPWALSSRQGDGISLIEGTQTGSMSATNQPAVRSVYAFWRNDTIQYEFGEWKEIE